MKLSRSDDKTHVLLEVELNNGLKLYKHRTVSLTQQHKGHIVNVEWINGFIKTMEITQFSQKLRKLRI